MQVGFWGCGELLQDVLLCNPASAVDFRFWWPQIRRVKILNVWRIGFKTGLLLAFLIMLNPGCASTPKPNWEQRIGSYTFDDTVREMGPPVASTNLQDGTMVAEWFLKYGAQMSFGFGTGMSGPVGEVGVGQTISPPPTAHYLRLIFGSDGKLQHWEKFKR